MEKEEADEVVGVEDDGDKADEEEEEETEEEKRGEEGGEAVNDNKDAAKVTGSCVYEPSRRSREPSEDRAYVT